MRRGIPIGLRNTDGAAAGNQVSIQPGASIAELTAGALFVWLLTTSTANTARTIASKSNGGPGGFDFVKRAVDGTQLLFTRYRGVGTPYQVNSPTGTLVANVPMFLFVTWDITTTAAGKIWKGTLDTPATALSATVTLGSGSGVNDTTQSLIVSNSPSGSAGWPGVIWAMGLSRQTNYTLDEVRRVQYNPLTFRNPAGLWLFNGLPVLDRSGNGNIGALLGTSKLTSDCLPRVSA